MNRCPKIIYTLFHGLGLMRLLISSQRNCVTILMLHGVIDPTLPMAWHPLRPQHTVKQLEKMLIFLAKYYKFTSLSDAIDMLSGAKPLTPKSLVLTFDDGYRNNLLYALPILRKFKAPATIYLTTGNITEQKPFWFDRLDFAIQQVAGKDMSAIHNFPELSEITNSDRTTFSSSFISFIRKEKKKHATDREMRASMENLSDRLEQYAGQGLEAFFRDDPWSGVLRWEDVRQSTAEVEFGSHGVDHKTLTRIPPRETLQELSASRDAIEFHTGKPCLHFAYPYGNFSQDVISLVKTCGYTSAMTTRPGVNKLGQNLFALHRMPSPRSENPADITATVSGISLLFGQFSCAMHRRC